MAPGASTGHLYAGYISEWMMVSPSGSLNPTPRPHPLFWLTGLLVYSKLVVRLGILLLFQYILPGHLLLALSLPSLATPSTSNFIFLSLAHVHRDFAQFRLEILRAGCKDAGDKRSRVPSNPAGWGVRRNSDLWWPPTEALGWQNGSASEGAKPEDPSSILGMHEVEEKTGSCNLCSSLHTNGVACVCPTPQYT